MDGKINPGFLKYWQKAYDYVIGEGGRVVDVYPKVGIHGVALVMKVKEGVSERFYILYYNERADENAYLEDENGNVMISEREMAEEDPDAYVDDMTTAARWEEEPNLWLDTVGTDSEPRVE
jgi:hypothetical protein